MPSAVNPPTCSCEGCDKPCKSGGLCSMHCARLRRNGTLDKVRSRKKSYVRPDGYVVEHAPDHPLANSANEVYQHRRVFYAAHGDGPFNCFECGIEVTWQTLHIDHIDDVTGNNALSNLRAACRKCNVRRGRHKIVDAYRKRSGLVYQGKSVTITDLARMRGISMPSMRARLKSMTVDEAMARPKCQLNDKRPWRLKRRTNSAK